MRIEELKQLIEKFYEGTATPSEMNSLTQYFSQEIIHDQFMIDKEVFQALSQSEKILVPTDLLPQLEKSINSFDNTKRKRKNILVLTLSVAASLILLVSVLNKRIGIFSPDNAKLSDKETFHDPEDAYNETEKALLIVSSKFNKGLSQLNIIDDEIDKTNNKFKKIIR